MAYMSGEQDASSYSNVATTVGVSLDSCSRSGSTVTIAYNVYGRNTNQWSQNSLAFWYGPNYSRHLAFNNTSGSSNHTVKNQNYYGGQETQSFSVGATTSSFNITIGVSQKYWDPSGQAGSLTFTVYDVPTATAPSGLSCSATNVTRTSATLSGSYSNIGDYSSYSSSSYEWGTSTSYGNTGSSMTNLSANTTYYYRYTVTNSSGLSSNTTGSFKTSGNAPYISRVSTSPTRQGCALTISASYDTNASYYSKRIDYGTTTNYGSYISGGNSGTSASITGLTPNTKYYYKVVVQDTQGRSSSAYTGSFTTTGNAPTIGTVYNLPQKDYGEFNADVTYDTNASFSSIEVQYGTTQSYGSTSNSWRIPPIGTSDLAHNTVYFYRFRVTDNFGRTSDWKTSSMTTKGDNPVVNSCTISNIKSKSATISANCTFDTNASLSSMSAEILLNGSFVTILSGNTNTINTGDILKPAKTYTIKVRVSDSYQKTSAVYETTLKTKGGFKFNGKMSDSIKINGKEVIGMKFNGIEII